MVAVIAYLDPATARCTLANIERMAIRATEKERHIIDIIEELDHIEFTRLGNAEMTALRQRGKKTFRD